MKESPYRKFSLKLHEISKYQQKMVFCQFELTFRCNLRCRHCYCSCYNEPEYIKQELGTKEVKFILDKIYAAGALWICFSGGDPLTRPDFLEIYSYAKSKGLLIIIFTNACALNKEIAAYLQKEPPFVIEMTLNAVTQKTYEAISQVEGSFAQAMSVLKLIRKKGLPLKIKTMITRQNVHQAQAIKGFVRKIGHRFRPTFLLHASLNKDKTPCNFRLSPAQVLQAGKALFPSRNKEIYSDCPNGAGSIIEQELDATTKPQNKLFNCAVGGRDGYVDPYGNMILCPSIRRQTVSLLKHSIEQAYERLYPEVALREFKTDSKCRSCPIRNFCMHCPGHSLLETGDLESPVDYFCELARLSKRNEQSSPQTK